MPQPYNITHQGPYSQGRSKRLHFSIQIKKISPRNLQWSQLVTSFLSYAKLKSQSTGTCFLSIVANYFNHTWFMASWKAVILGHLFSLSVFHILAPRGKEERLVERLKEVIFLWVNLEHRKRNAYTWDLKIQNEWMALWGRKRNKGGDRRNVC